MDLQQWAQQEEENKEPISVIELEKLCAEAADLKENQKALEDEADAISKQFNQKMMLIQTHLEKIGKDKYKAETGTFYIQTEFSVTTPKTEEEKKALFDYLTEKQIYWQYATVNSKSLNSLYKSLLKSEGEMFELPGVQPPKYYEKLKMRKS